MTGTEVGVVAPPDEPSGPSGPVEGRARRRPRPATPWVALAALLVTAVAGVAWTGLHRPVTVDGTMTAVQLLPGLPDPDVDGGWSAPVEGAVEEVDNAYGTEFTVRAPADGEALHLVMAVRNTARVPVVLTDVLVPFAEDPLDLTDAGTVQVPADEQWSEWRPLDGGVRLPPGRSLPVRLLATFDVSCGSGVPTVEAGGAVGTDQVTLRYETLGLSRAVTTTMPYMVMVEGPLGCP